MKRRRDTDAIGYIRADVVSVLCSDCRKLHYRVRFRVFKRGRVVLDEMVGAFLSEAAAQAFGLVLVPAYIDQVNKEELMN